VFAWLVFCFLLCVSEILLRTSELLGVSNKLLLCWIFQWIENVTVPLIGKSYEFVFIDMLFCFVLMIYKGITELQWAQNFGIHLEE